MTPEERLIVSNLANCRYQPGTWCKRFVNDINSAAQANPELQLSESQREWLYRVLYMKRKSLPYVYNIFKNHPFCKRKEK